MRAVADAVRQSDDDERERLHAHALSFAFFEP
jgi:hypothetical protein